MDREDIIRMAREVGIDAERDTLCSYEGWVEPLERFAALVAEHEREKVVQWMMERGYATGHGDTIQDLIKEVEWQVAELENEACAKVADLVAREIDNTNNTASYIASGIRERGEK